MNQPQRKPVIINKELNNYDFFVQVTGQQRQVSLSFDGAPGHHTFWISLVELEQIRQAIVEAQKEVENDK